MLLINNRDTTDAATNLAIEEYAVRHLPAGQDYLLLYRNRKALVIGKHQNHIQEANLRFCAENQIPVLRRISGGGAVYHDAGNLNFGIITRKTMRNFNRYREFLQPILTALKGIDVPAELDKRNNIVAGGLKLSGNAQFTSRERLLSHGTLLLHSDLAMLRGALAQLPNRIIKSRASQSAPASVTNVSDIISRQIGFDEMKSLIIREFDDIGNLAFSEKQWREIEDLAETKFRTVAWNMEKSPPCHIRRRHEEFESEIEVEMGRIKKMRVRSSIGSWDLTDRLAGCLYDFDEVIKASLKLNSAPYPFIIEKLIF